MKKLLLLSLAVLFACCTKDLNLTQFTIRNGEFYASIEDTRTHLDKELLTHWTEGDKITIFLEGTPSTYLFQGKTGDRTGTFSELKAPVGPSQNTSAAPVALYPQNEHATQGQDGSVSAILPKEQLYAENSYGQDANTMLATVDLSSKTLSFKNVCGFLKVNLFAQNITVKNVTLAGNNGEKLAGKANLSFDQNKLPKVTLLSDATTSITLNAPSGIKLGENSTESTAFFFAVPPTHFTEGFSLEIEDTQGNKYLKKTTKDITVERNAVVDMREFLVGDPSTKYSYTSAKWEFTTTNMKSAADAWIKNNVVYAHEGEYSNKAYISTFKGGTNEPERTLADSRLTFGKIGENDGLLFTVPTGFVKAGSNVDFMITLRANAKDSPKYWVCEIFDGGEWRTASEDLLVAKEDPSLKYSFQVKYFSSSNYTTFLQTFTTTHAIEGDLLVRCRAVGKLNNGGGTLTPSSQGTMYIPGATYRSCYIDIYQNAIVKDEKDVLVLGNSFTYYFGTPFFLKEIARSQGHLLNIRTNLKGGQTFAQHSALELSKEVMNIGGYDIALLQDQSCQHSNYYSNIKGNASVLTDTKAILSTIKAKSPSCQPIIECTWSYAGSDGTYMGYKSYDVFDKALQGGAKLVCHDTNSWMSPIGMAFQKARAEGINDLFSSDSKHPNRNGAYLKSCVNYLMIYNTAFDSNVPNCVVDKTTAAKLRKIAEEVVLGHVEEYRTPDISDVHPGDIDPVDPGDIVEGESGIRTKEQLLSFAKLVNVGGNISSYQNDEGEVELLADIDLQGVEWTPIGSATSCPANVKQVPLQPFIGKFNGGGFKIKNLNISITTNTVNVMGFFGATQDCQIKNLVFENAKLDYTAKGISTGHIAIGTLIGYAYNTKVENVDVNATFTGTATSTAERNVAVGGIIGIITSQGQDHLSSIIGCTFSGSMTNDIGTKYSTSNSANIAGIVSEASASGQYVLIKDCINNATINVKAHKAAGIITQSFFCNIESCINNGDITISHSANKAGTTAGTRTGGIMSYCSTTSANNSYLKGCVNNATITSLESGSAVGGIVGLMRCYKLIDCKNRGDIICNDADPHGLLVGSVTSATVNSTVTNCYLRGTISTKTDKSDAKAATAENYLEQGVGITLASGVSLPTWTSENVHFLTE
ncbi:MAG: hypothetical protein KBS95_00085 [Alistipes sp.]|nr:hypothetical protein [Candidatus Alistipes equi]